MSIALLSPPPHNTALAALAELRPIAKRHQTTIGNLALAWLIAQPQTTAIVGVRNARQAKDNAKAATLQLSQQDLEDLDAISRTVTEHVDTDPVMWNFGG